MVLDDMAPINEAIRLRGLFVQHYSGVEWAIAALILHSQQHPAYTEFRGLPWAWSGKQSKLRRVQSLIDQPGPLRAHADAILEFLAAFAELDERRNFMVHAIMTQDKTATAVPRFRFVMFRPTKEGTDYGLMFATMAEMEALANAVQPISAGVTELVARILRTLDVPPIVAMYDMTAPPPFNLKLGGRL